MAEKKIIVIQREELLFLREAILDNYAQTIESPDDKGRLRKFDRSYYGKGAQNMGLSQELPHNLVHGEGRIVI